MRWLPQWIENKRLAVNEVLESIPVGAFKLDRDDDLQLLLLVDYQRPFTRNLHTALQHLRLRMRTDFYGSTPFA